VPLWLGLALGVVLGVLISLVFTTAAPDQATIGFSHDQVVIAPLGAMRVWSRSRGLMLPATAIAAVGVGDRRELRRGIRWPGVSVPRLLRAGTYRRKEGKELWFVGRAQDVVVVELIDQPYRRVILEVAEPAAVVGALRAALGRP
jgi:hypothetical protein